MTQYIAFLRAINVGGRFAKMDLLRGLFEEIGFSNVASYIQSGNIVFESSNADLTELEQKIEARLQQALGFDVPAFVRTQTELIKIAKYQPFQEAITEDSTQYVSFLREAPSPEAFQKLLSLSTDVDIFHLKGNHLFWLYQRHLGESGFTNTKIEKILATPATRRNTNTVHKIVNKYFSPAA